jgi:hypothetical protein
MDGATPDHDLEKGKMSRRNRISVRTNSVNSMIVQLTGMKGVASPSIDVPQSVAGAGCLEG